MPDPDPVPALAYERLGAFDMTSTSGGVGRVLHRADMDGNAVDASGETLTDQNNLTPAPFEVDDKEAVLLIISDTNINALLQAPLTTKLLDLDTTITYADTPTIQDGAGSGRPIFAHSTDNTVVSGRIFPQPDSSASNVYIDGHAPVVLGYEVSTGFTGENPEFAIIGEPLPTTLDDFSGTYSGFAAVARENSGRINSERGTFQMMVSFANGESTITRFDADFVSGGFSSPTMSGSIDATNIPIANGIFSNANGGTVTFVAGPAALSVINTDNAGSGTLLGSFHGTAGNGVTGAFHSANNSVFGGFAGSKETPAP